MPKKANKAAFQPYVVRDPYSMGGATWLVLKETPLGVVAVGFQPSYCPGPMVGVHDRVITRWQLQNYPILDEKSSCTSLIEGIKEKMLTHGASALAVHWVNEIEPFSDKEMNTMAEKLKTKGATKAAPASKPAAGGGKKGNVAALEKAREASAGARAANDAKKIKFIGKDVAVREGSVREELKAFAKTAKTVGELKANETSKGKNVSSGDVKWLEEAGIIEIA